MIDRPGPSAPLPTHLFEVLASHPTARPFAHLGDEILTWGQLGARLRQTQRLFEDHGIGVGSRLLLACRDEVALIIAYAACIYTGVTAVIVDPALPERRMAEVIALTTPAAALVDAFDGPSPFPPGTLVLQAGHSRPSGLLSKLLRRKVAQTSAYPARVEQLAEAPHPRSFPSDTPAYILFTSGSTGGPKGVEVSHGALHAHLQTLVSVLGYGRQSRILEELPLHHTDGIHQGPSVALFAGATLFRSGPFSIATLPRVVDWIHRHHITHFYTVPTVLALMERLIDVDDTLSGSGLHRVISSAGPLDEALWRRFEARFAVAVVNLYGMTETISGSLYCGPSDALRRVGTLGRPVDCELRVVSETGAAVTRGEAGELHLRGPHLMTRYFGDPERTETVLRDGWLATGDRVRLDDDGFVHLLGRVDQLVLRGGTSIQPETVAEALELLPEVMEAAAFGAPDPLWGQRLVAAVVLSERAAAAGAAVDTMMAAARRVLQPELLPDALHIVAALPRGPAGKVRLGVLRDTCGAPQPQIGAGETLQTVCALAARCFRVDRGALSGASSAESTPGWDSLAHMQLVAAIETTWGVRLSTRDILRLRSLSAAAAIVDEAVLR